MKKIFTLSLSLLTASIGFSQNAPIDFETSGKGATWTWKTFENVTDPVLEIIDNPDSKAPNTSAKVAKFTALQGGNPWAGCESQKTLDIGTFTLSASNAIIKIMVWKSTISDVGIKFVKNDNSAIPEIKVPNTKINQWEELTFDFTSKIGTAESKDITQIVIFPDFIPGGPGARTATTISYFDNITFSGGTPIAEPTVAAKAPTKKAADVISLYSDAYTNVAVDTWRTSWSVATLADVKIGTDSVKKYAGLDYVGIETIAKQIDISTMDSFEFDMWTPNSTTFKVKLVDFGANGAFGGGDDKEHELSVTPTLNGWNHISLALSNFTGLITKKNIAQLIFSSTPAGTSVVYIDNILFSKGGAVVINEPTVAAKAPTKLAADVISLYSDAYNNVAVDTWRASWSVASLADVKIGTDSVKKYAGLDYVGIETIAKQIDISTMDSFEFDMWTPNSTDFKIKLVDFGANGKFDGPNTADDKEHQLSVTPTLSGWNHISLALSNFTGLTTKKNIAQLIFSSTPAGTSVVYIDNILFSKKAKVGINSAKQESVGVYPNPATSLLNINTTKAIENVFIYNSLGQIVLTSSPNSNFAAINIADLPEGFYTVKASINGVDSFSKFIKE